MIAFNYVIGEFIILFIAYFVRHWKTINDIISAFTVVVTILFFFLVDESPIWLATQKNYKKTMTILKKIARINKKELNLNNLDSNVSNEEIMLETKISSIENSSNEITLKSGESMSIKNTLKAIFTPKSMLLKTCLTSYVWFVSHLLYFGIALGISSVKGVNPYILFIFQSIAEITGYWICMLNDKFGRRKMNIFYLLSSAIVCLIYSLLPRNKDLSDEKKVLEDAILVICLISIGKCMVSASFNTLYVYTTELYDTNVRNFGLLFCTCIGSIGSLISPEIITLSHVWGPLPYLIFSISAFFGSICVFILPETLKKSSK
jgi:MFS family permease